MRNYTKITDFDSMLDVFFMLKRAQGWSWEEILQGVSCGYDQIECNNDWFFENMSWIFGEEEYDEEFVRKIKDARKSLSEPMTWEELFKELGIED